MSKIKFYLFLNPSFMSFKFIFVVLFAGIFASISAQEVAVLKYNGGGDWYSNRRTT